MAYMNQEKKAKIAAQLKQIFPKGWKYSLGVSNHSTIVLTIMKAPVDLIAMANELNRERAEMRNETPYEIKGSYQGNPYYPENQFKGETLDLMKKAIDALYSADYYDRSDIMTDLVNVAYYVNLNIGRWDKPFQVSE